MRYALTNGCGLFLSNLGGRFHLVERLEDATEFCGPGSAWQLAYSLHSRLGKLHVYDRDS
jgi:hypothetical protein